MNDDALREGDVHGAQGGEGAEASSEGGLQRNAGPVCGEGGKVAGWGGQDCRDGGVVGEGGEVEDSQGVEERVGFSVCLAAGEADGVRRGGG